MNKSTGKIIKQIRDLLICHKDLGITDYPDNATLKGFLADTPDAPTPPASLVDRLHGVRKPVGKVAISSQPPQPQAEKIPKTSIAEIRRELGECERCPLHATRQQLIFGTGNEEAKLFIIEDQPGDAEEASGTPISGPPGDLLDRMLQAIGLSRAEVYITSLVKCAPPEERNPSTQEIKSCLPFLRRQLASVNPKIVCTMGPNAARTLTALNKPVSRLRGKSYNFQGFTIFPTFHPQFLLKNEEMKKPAWLDLQMIEKKLKT